MSALKKVLFVCVENSCRSQIAEGYAKHLGKGVIEAYSAGSHPSGVINPKAIDVMKEDGIDISGQASKGFTDIRQDNIDLVITLGCGDTCPFVPAEKHIAWDIDDPKGKNIEYFRKIRDNIKTRLMELLMKMNSDKRSEKPK